MTHAVPRSPATVPLRIRGNLRQMYPDVFTPEALAALGAKVISLPPEPELPVLYFNPGRLSMSKTPCRIRATTEPSPAD